MNGIILFDEFDKARYNESSGNCQQNLLTMIEGRGISITRSLSTKNIPTDRMLFIFAGAFQGLDEQIKSKKKANSIGFGGQLYFDDSECIAATMDDICQYGFNRELLGRIGTIHHIPPMRTADYRNLLCGEGNSVKAQYGALFDVSGVDFDITEAACETISKMAESRRMGARALPAIMQETLTDSFGAVDNDEAITEVILDSVNDSLCIQYRKMASASISHGTIRVFLK